MPRLVSRIAGGSAKMTVAIIAVAAPMLNNSTTATRYENAGTVCIASSTGRNARSSMGCRADRIPTGIPIARATVTDSSTSASVSRAPGHRPSTPIRKNPAAAPIAIRHPASRPAIAPTATVRPSQVRRDSPSTIWSTALLMPFFSGTRKCTNSGCVRWCSITQSLNALNGLAASNTSDSGKPPVNATSPTAITATTTPVQISLRRHGCSA